MSNPTNGVWQFDGASGSFVITGPERYDSGLWLEEGTTNRMANPSVETNTTNWAATSGLTLTQDGSQASDGTKSVNVVAASGSIGKRLLAATATGLATAGGISVAVAIDLWGTGTVKLQASVDYTDASSDAGTMGSDIVLTATPTRYYAAPMATNGAKTINVARVSAWCQTAAVNFNGDAAQVEWKAYSTSYTGTTRAASSAAISPAGILSPTEGGFAIKAFRRKLDTGSAEVLLESGTSGSGTDRLRLYINSSDKLVMEWVSDGAAATTLTTAASIATNTDYFIYADWKDTLVRLRLDAVMATGTRNTPEGSWGAGALTLKAA